MADDVLIASYATANNAILITKDSDFSGPRFYDKRPKVLWVRLGNCSNLAMFAKFDATLEQIVARFESGGRIMELR